MILWLIFGGATAILFALPFLLFRRLAAATLRRVFRRP